MPLARPTIVLFDMDGTTVRHLHPALLNFLEWLDDLAHRGARLASKLLRRDIAPPPIVEVHNGIRPKLLVHRAIHKIRRKEVDQIVEPCPGIFRILEFLRARNIPVGLVSNSLGTGYGHDILDKFDLAQYFAVTLFREDVTRPKPFPDSILLALKSLPRPPGTDDVVWYIGDRHKDITAALAARKHLPCPVVPFAYGLKAAIAILERNVGVDHIVMAYPDLETKLRNLFTHKA